MSITCLPMEMTEMILIRRNEYLPIKYLFIQYHAISWYPAKSSPSKIWKVVCMVCKCPKALWWQTGLQIIEHDNWYWPIIYSAFQNEWGDRIDRRCHALPLLLRPTSNARRDRDMVEHFIAICPVLSIFASLPVMMMNPTAIISATGVEDTASRTCFR